MATKLPFADSPFQQRDIPLFPIPKSKGVDVPREKILNACVVRLLGGILDDCFVVGESPFGAPGSFTSPVIATKPLVRS